MSSSSIGASSLAPPASTSSSSLSTPSSASASMTPYEHAATFQNTSAVVSGHVLSGDGLIEYSKKHGLCPFCAQTKTHTRHSKIMSVRWVPKDVDYSPQGDLVVYKGFCIQPTCFSSLEHVQVLLGERSASNHRSKRSSGSSTGRSTVTSPRATRANRSNSSRNNVNSNANNNANNNDNSNANSNANNNANSNSNSNAKRRGSNNLNSLSNHSSTSDHNASFSSDLDEFNPQMTPRGSKVRTRTGAADIQAVINLQRTFPNLPSESLYPSITSPSPSNRSSGMPGTSIDDLRLTPRTAAHTRAFLHSEPALPVANDLPSAQTLPNTKEASAYSHSARSAPSLSQYNQCKPTNGLTVDNIASMMKQIKTGQPPTLEPSSMATATANGDPARSRSRSPNQPNLNSLSSPTTSAKRAIPIQNQPSTPAPSSASSQPHTQSAHQFLSHTHVRPSTQTQQQQQQQQHVASSKPTSTNSSNDTSSSTRHDRSRNGAIEDSGARGVVMKENREPLLRISASHPPSKGHLRIADGHISSSFDDDDDDRDDLQRMQKHIDDPAMVELKLLIDDRDYIEFFACLERRAVLPAVCAIAISLFNKKFMEHQLSAPRSVILVGDNWIKTLFKHIKEFYVQDPNVVIAGLTTFVCVTMLADSTFYKQAMLKKGAAVQCALTLLEHYGPNSDGFAPLQTSGGLSAKTLRAKHSKVLTLTCAWMEIMSTSEETGISATSKGNVNKLIQTMVGIVVRGSHAAPKPYAVRALFHWSCQRRKSDLNTTLGQDVRNAMKDTCIGATKGQTVTVLQDIAMEYAALHEAQRNDGEDGDFNQSTFESVMGLLWRLSVPLTEQDIGNMDSKWSTMGWLRFLLAVLESQTSAAFPSFVVMEACVGLMANLSVLIQFPLDLARPYIEGITQCILTHSLNPSPQILAKHQSTNEAATTAAHPHRSVSTFSPHERLGLAGVHAICNMISSKTRRDRAWRGPGCKTVSLECIMKIWQRHPRLADLQELACLSVAYACQGNKDQETMNALVELGVLGQIKSSFDLFVAIPSQGSRLEAKEATLCAVSVLSRCHAGAVELERNELGLMLMKHLKLETKDRFKTIIQHTLRNCKDHGKEILIPMSSLPLAERLIDHFMDDVMLNCLRQYVQNGLPIADPILGPAIEGLFHCMEDQKKAASIQDEGTHIISMLCYQLPFSRWEQSIIIEGSIVSDIFLTQRLLSILGTAMKQHRSNTSIQISACTAVANILTKVETDDDPTLRRAVEPFLKQVLDVLQCHRHQNVKVDMAAVQLFWSLVVTCNPDDLRRWSVRILQSVLESMKTFESHQDMLVLCCDCLMSLQHDKDCLEVIGTADGVSLLMKLQLSQYDNIAISAAGALSAVLKLVFTSSRHIMAESEAISFLILSMTQRCDILMAQIYICSIFESILTLEDDHVKTTIGDGGGFNVICGSLENHGTDATFVGHACRCLSSMIPFLLPDTFEPMRESLGSAVKACFESHAENEDIQSLLLAVWAACCTRDLCDDGFYLRYLVEDTSGVSSIQRAMVTHIGSLEVQQHCCTLVRLLTTPSQHRATLGKMGLGQNVLNAMIVHNQAASLIREGLFAMKNLAAEQTNKEALQAINSERMLTHLLWMNFDDASVLSAGLPAMNNIAVDVVQRTISALHESVIQLVMLAMKHNPDDMALQKNGCFLLKSCTYNPINIRTMMKHKAGLIEVLKAASQQFPESCKDRAECIALKLETFQ